MVGNGLVSAKYTAGLQKGGRYHVLAGRQWGVQTMAEVLQPLRARQIALRAGNLANICRMNACSLLWGRQGEMTGL